MSARPKRCPRCWASGVERQLQRGRTGTFGLDVCESCGGVWLGSEGADKVLADAQHQPSGKPPSLFCPCCDGGMTPWLVRPAGVIVDRCDADGTWFDVREIDAICAEAAERKGVRLPARAAAVVGVGAMATAAAAGAAAALAVADVSRPPGPSVGGRVAQEVLVEMPETVYFGAEAIGGAVADSGIVQTGADVAHEAVDAGSGLLEVVTEALGALFD